MAQEKIRLFQLAAQLNMKAKDLLELCQKNGMSLTNQLNTLDPEQRDKVVELVRRGPSAQASTRSAPSPTVPPPVNRDRAIKTLETPRRPAVKETRVPEPSTPAPAPEPVPEPAPAPAPVAETPAPPPPVVSPAPAAPVAVSEPEPAPAPVRPAPVAEQKPAAPVPAPTPAAPPEPPAPAVPTPPAAVTPPAPVLPPAPVTPPAAVTPPAPPPTGPSKAPERKAPEPITPPAPAVPEQPAASRPQTPPPAPTPPAPPAPAQPTPAQPPAAATPPPPAQSPRPPVVPPPARPMRDLSGSNRPRPPMTRPPEKGPQQGQGQGQGQGRPAGQQPSNFRMASPPPRKPGTTAGEEKKPAPPPPSTGPKKLADIPPELMQSNKPIRLEDILRSTAAKSATTPSPAGPDVEIEEEDESKKDGKKKRPGGIVGRDQRHADRAKRAQERQTRGDTGKGLLVDESDSPRATRLLKRKRKLERGTQPRKGKVPIELPITVRSLSEAIGIKAADLTKKLFLQGITATINTPLDPEVAEMIALEHGAELDIKKQLDAEDRLLTELDKPDEEESLRPRAPIVTIMGHVDHGKTSLLDYIRKSNVVDTEAGRITQSLRAWRVDHNGRPITFLDTPGHEAFTKMRARGANVTDIAVIVVAASDGVQPQTEEAISHAKAAGVDIVVAVNKVDLPNANIKRTEQQLYGLGLIPDTMGGEVPFVYTSAVTGQGVDTLLDTLSLVAELAELKANPDKHARGTCLEASVSEGQGVVATVLVQEGTLKRGDYLLCGATHGRVRALFNDVGQAIDEAGPSVPCRIIGLDEIPNADDPFVVVSDMTQARDIAEKRRAKIQEASLRGREPLGLDALVQSAKVTELKVIIKADVRGSVEAIKKELEKLQHEEVKLRILHTGIGAINESDVSLAAISPSDTIIVGFNVVPDDAARSLADAGRIQLREYQIIYELTNDIKAAMEGKLKPREEIIHLGRAVVRELFKISRVGTIAGCRVTQGTIERSGKVRVIRNGVVVYPPADRTVGLDSLKRYKDDVREVNQGYDCGIKIVGYDDVKVDDVIECYRIEQVQRTL